MAKRIFLDTGPLGLACKKPGDPKAEACRKWIKGPLEMGHSVTVPEIADYELRRELLRNAFGDWLLRLDGLASSLDYLPINTTAMRRAAEFWAELRRAGVGTADDKELDADAILAAQAVTSAQPDDEVIVAATNVGHLSRFPGVVALPWDYVT